LGNDSRVEISELGRCSVVGVQLHQPLRHGRNRLTTVGPKKDDLRTLAIFLDLPVSTAVQAAVVTTAADLIFARDFEHKVFTMNTANTLAYRALKALEDRCVVEIAETLKDEHNMIPATAAIRRKPELRNHRDAVSHTTTISWRRADMQVFSIPRSSGPISAPPSSGTCGGPSTAI
jgi:hypothetical protein